MIDTGKAYVLASEEHLAVHHVMLDGVEINVYIKLNMLRAMERARRPGNYTAGRGGVFICHANSLERAV